MALSLKLEFLDPALTLVNLNPNADSIGIIERTPSHSHHDLRTLPSSMKTGDLLVTLALLSFFMAVQKFTCPLFSRGCSSVRLASRSRYPPEILLRGKFFGIQVASAPPPIQITAVFTFGTRFITLLRSSREISYRPKLASVMAITNQSS